MYQRSLLFLLFSKPITQGYVAQLPQPAPTRRCTSWRRAFENNDEVRKKYTPDAERYEEWYKATYGLESLSDGCAASGATSNRRLDDTQNMESVPSLDDFCAVEEEVEFCSRQFNHNTLVR
ncbi:hypothetical protein C3747_22g1705c [Trypanosoma cruzi]|uniref:Uncharacterized protein n=2 Tax=Trypanosoma cruzi TaxID=5693 RepID=Q4DVF4_TRYCC|nr:hypothetical protein, conserved [Trypanosoma cruzi]XP_819350.1 hypothetical protein, conserved [Trypanosoma cruzi]PBJ71073.1 hypothetical protein BCY84_17406 [Trypanosoma cruzi cruzi]EAN96524.1 hypothetical protein, conserved [Trypanosoma cruzi]EAN97499.1 hypothetical protein, conserved [Trypanosoma cruzi]KAF8280751.1 hypothetical protein TcBrA4_0093690 [Trypanosoma cruzi]PWU88292.1 hypothetical protein C4B63_76g35c [Trypanosoma cruzi]|eukprot:XP_818375.1 hypothetical protein [Trypanosoma cruzi strain CL Brener]